MAPLDPGNIRTFSTALEDAAEGYNRYLVLYLIDARGEVLADAGNGALRDDTLDLIDPFREPGMGGSGNGRGL